jgi:hypothetical protein
MKLFKKLSVINIYPRKMPIPNITCAPKFDNCLNGINLREPVSIQLLYKLAYSNLIKKTSNLSEKDITELIDVHFTTEWTRELGSRDGKRSRHTRIQHWLLGQRPSSRCTGSNQGS